MLTRRGLIGGLIAAPAVVAAGSLMPVRSIEQFGRVLLDEATMWNDFSITGWIKRDGMWRHIAIVHGRTFVNGELGQARPYEVAALKEWVDSWRIAYR